MISWIDPGDHAERPRRRRVKYLDMSLPLFTINSDYKVAYRPIARASDPSTSHISARQFTASGQLGEQMRETLDTLKHYIARTGETPTSAELAAGDTDARFRYARRLADLRANGGYVQNGEPRICRATGKLALTWEPICHP